MLRFKKTLTLDGVNFLKQLEVPENALAVPIHRNDMPVVCLVEPSHFRGMMVKVPLENMDDLEEIADPRCDVILQPKQDGDFMAGDDLEETLMEVSSQLASRGQKELARECFELSSKARKRRYVRTPYPPNTWYSSKSSSFPAFYLVKFDHSSFFIREPGKTILRPIGWEEMMRSDPKEMTKEEAQSLGIEIKPEEWGGEENDPIINPNPIKG